MNQKKYAYLLSLSLMLITCYIHADDSEKPLIERYEEPPEENGAVARAFLEKARVCTTPVPSPATITSEGLFAILENRRISQFEIHTGKTHVFPNEIPNGDVCRLGVGTTGFYVLYESGRVWYVPKEAGTSKKILEGVQGSLFDVDGSTIYYRQQGKPIIIQGKHDPSHPVSFEVESSVDYSTLGKTIKERRFSWLPWFSKQTFKPHFESYDEINRLRGQGGVCKIGVRKINGPEKTVYFDLRTNNQQIPNDESPFKSRAYGSPGYVFHTWWGVTCATLVAYAVNTPGMLELVSLADQAQSNNAFIDEEMLTENQRQALEHPFWGKILEKYLS